jgi:RNA-binding protein
MDPLSPAERRALKARAHALHPLVSLGGKGLTDAVLVEVERALAAHELIKVRAPGMDRDERETVLAALCEHCAAHPVQHIGKVLVLYREKPVELPDEKPASSRPPRAKHRVSRGTERPKFAPPRRRAKKASPIRRPRRG